MRRERRKSLTRREWAEITSRRPVVRRIPPSGRGGRRSGARPPSGPDLTDPTKVGSYNMNDEGSN
jgi:hypothetical protein